MSVVVSDTTPLNYLILLGHTEVLPRLFGKLLIPPAVIREMQHAKTPRAVFAWTTQLPAWVEIRAPVSDMNLQPGAGKNEAISLAAELPGSALLVDDRKARVEAEVRGILTIGTITILDLADEAGLLDFEIAVQGLRATTFHAEETLLTAVLDKVRARKKR